MTDCRDLVVILEASPNRLAPMRDALASRSSDIEIRSFDNVWAMRKELLPLLAQACLISLDCNLSNSSTKNPGNGMDAVQILNRQEPVCPVIVHTSLAEDGRAMEQALRGGGWHVEQVVFNRREALADWIAAAEELVSKLGKDSEEQ
jgi:hypothetical protein